MPPGVKKMTKIRICKNTNFSCFFLLFFSKKFDIFLSKKIPRFWQKIVSGTPMPQRLSFDNGLIRPGTPLKSQKTDFPSKAHFDMSCTSPPSSYSRSRKIPKKWAQWRTSGLTNATTISVNESRVFAFFGDPPGDPPKRGKKIWQKCRQKTTKKSSVFLQSFTSKKIAKKLNFLLADS